MPLVGEWADRKYAYAGGSWHSESWDLDFGPSAAFMKVFLGEWVAQGHSYAGALTGILNIRRLKPEGGEETIAFPSLTSYDSVATWFDPAMTHVTFGIRVTGGRGKVTWTLGFWE
jgi:hypothetical protein